MRVDPGNDSSGLRVSRLCLGTMIFGRQVAEEAAFAVLDKARSTGSTASAVLVSVGQAVSRSARARAIVPHLHRR